MSILVSLSVIASSAAAVAFSWLTVTHRSLIYSALFLSLLGLANAAIFFILGFILVAFMQIIIYVGAAVLFIIMSVSMMKEPPKMYIGVKYAALGAAAALAIALFLMLFAGSRLSLAPISVSITSMVNYLVSYGYAGLIVLFIMLSIALLASIAIVRRDD